MPYFVLGIAILIGAVLAGRWYVSAQPSSILRVFKWIAIIGAIILGAVVILTRQFAWAAFALPALLPWFFRARRVSRMAKNWARMSSAAASGSGTAPGQTSEIETKYLRMYLVHDTGEMNGDIILGDYSGRTLRSLTFEELLAVMEEVKGDNHSVQVLTAYLERYHDDAWRDRVYSSEKTSPDAGGTSSVMTRKEAYKVLGLEEGATKEKIKEAHKRLMNKIHPDHGGSTYLATKLNEAKDFLLKQ